MANREELLIIRAARAGEASAQLMLGKRYLFGGAGLPKSLATALYWLDRAAQQNEQDAWMLIGRHVPFETVQQATQPAKLYVWYERAFEAGVAQAGLVLARLVLSQAPGMVSEDMRSKAVRALQAAAHAGIAEAQWLLAQTLSRSHGDSLTTWPAASAGESADDEAMREWATRAARSGVAEAQYALADHAWARSDLSAFLQWALPMARKVTGTAASGAMSAAREVALAMRVAHALFAQASFDAAEIAHFLEWAAQTGDRHAQYSFGLWLARMDGEGNRIASIPGPANYKRAIRWLSLSGGQGLPEAWFALSKIYLKAECSQRNLSDARRCLERAAKAGHGVAQMELGQALWRGRRESAENDVQAAQWLQKAVAQNVEGASGALLKIAGPLLEATWAKVALGRMTRDATEANPLFAARLELAVLFGLSRTEALLIDPRAADKGHCLVVDIRAAHPHSRRRLVLVRNAEQRQLLDRVTALFERVDSGPDGPEGNYRQRLYRLKTL